LTDSTKRQGRVRRFFGGLVQYLQRDQIRTVADETRRLGSASVESLSYVRDELRALNERISRIEEEIAALRARDEA
jgi:hypothetical protein